MWKRFWITSLRNILTSSYFCTFSLGSEANSDNIRRCLLPIHHNVIYGSPWYCARKFPVSITHLGCSAIRHFHSWQLDPRSKIKIQFLDMLHAFHKFLPSLSFCIQCLILHTSLSKDGSGLTHCQVTHCHRVLFYSSRGWLAADKPCWHRWFAWQYGKGPQPKTREPVALWSLQLVVKFENEISRHQRICQSLPMKVYSKLLMH